MTDIDVEDYANLKAQYDDLKQRFDVLEEKAKQFDTTIAEKDERIRNLNDALYKATFTRAKDNGPEQMDSEPKDFSDLYLDALDGMKNKR